MREGIGMPLKAHLNGRVPEKYKNWHPNVILLIFHFCGGFAKGVVSKRGGSKKTERRYIRMFPGAKNRNEGTFAKPPFYETALLFPLDFDRCKGGSLGSQIPTSFGNVSQRRGHGPLGFARNFQKRPDVHKIILSMKWRPPPPSEKVSIFRIFYWFVQFFPRFGPFSGRENIP